MPDHKDGEQGGGAPPYLGDRIFRQRVWPYAFARQAGREPFAGEGDEGGGVKHADEEGGKGVGEDEEEAKIRPGEGIATASWYRWRR